MELLDIMYQRKSLRKYSGEEVPKEKLDMILKAGLLAPSGRRAKPWEFIVVRDKDMLQKLADARTGAANMLKGADCAIVVVADGEKTDVWTEDCSIAMAHMHLMASHVGVGSCWIQGRLREAANGMSSDEYVRGLLEVPAGYKLEAILSLGMPEEIPAGYTEEDLLTEKIHYERF